MENLPRNEPEKLEQEEKTRWEQGYLETRQDQWQLRKIPFHGMLL